MKTTPTVAFVKCSTYAAGLAQAISRLLGHLGGLEAFVKPGQTVLIKPNLLSDAAPARAVTTHPEVVRCVIHLLKDLGTTPVIADSPSSVIRLRHVWERTGFAALAREEHVPILNLEQSGARPFHRNGYSFHIAKPILDADVVINMPKVKTHVLTTLTAGVKNMYGAVPGYQKTALHKQHPAVSDFGKLLCAIHDSVQPTLTIADAVEAMQGDGPSAGSVARLGFLAASANAYALDSLLCRILKINPSSVPYLRQYVHRSCRDDIEHSIEALGAGPDELMPSAFRVPSTIWSRLIPTPLIHALDRFLWIHPEISDACVSCGRCVEACPTGALILTPGSKPELAASKCISCCCCHEVCPAKAVSMQQSPLLNFLRRGKMP